MIVYNFMRCIRRRLFTITICLSLLIIIARIYNKSLYVPETNYNISWIDSLNMTLDRLDKPYCNNTLQGATKVTDDRGFLCLRRNLLANGCCDRSKRLTLRHVCSTCSSIFCCQSYEICVSCCLNPINISLWKNVLLLAKIENQLSILSSKSVFELCSSRCRTSSESVINANAYRDPLRKYCFGVDPPELKISYDKDDDFES
ncbi:unnamed protein product [Hymenolepis diminuta]|uniref:SREBP regulating gene protein n=1 Tax=Hymenolepis diminuta TaxID=6216 RepID=A0A564XZT8_HYMDI|nr:unnamed protein product [Hymenolepis diminuta]